MQVYLKSQAFAQQCGTYLIVSQEFKEDFLTLLPHLDTLALTAYSSADFMREIDLIYFIQSWSDIFENLCHIGIKFQIQSIFAFNSKPLVVFIDYGLMQRQKMLGDEILESFGGCYIREYVFSHFGQCLQEYFEWHIYMMIV